MIYINFLICLLLIINYNLALAYIGVTKKLKDTLIPSLLVTIVAFISKIIFFAPMVIHTIVLVLTCAVFLHVINKVGFLLSIIGSLLSFMTLTFGSFLIACPLLIFLGFVIPKQNEIGSFRWIVLAIAEFFIPSLVLIIIKVKKLSIAKYLIIT